MVGSSSMRTSPALTLWPSRTWIARTTPVSNGWIVFVRPLGMILPGATATMSTVPMHAQPSATANTAMMVKATARPTGDGGVSTISSAAGRNASSSFRRCARPAGKATIFLADFMQTCLEPIECRIAAAGLDQIVVRAVLDQAAALDGDDAIGKPQRGEPMGNDKHRSAAGDLGHVLLNNALALVVERARRLVEDEDARVGNQRTGDGDALPLAAGQAAAALSHDRVVAFRQFEDEVVGAGKLRRGNDTLGRQGGIGQRDVFPDRAVEQHVFLKHDADLAAQPGRIDLREIDAIDQHAATFGDIEALGELGERALARPGRADDAEQLTGRNGQADIVQHFRPIDAVAEGDMLERDVAADGGERGAARAVDRLGRGIEDIAKPLDRQARLMKILPDLGEAQHRCTDTTGQEVEGDQFAHGEVAVDDQPCPEIKNACHDQLADELHDLTRGVAQADDPETGRDIAGELLFPSALHLRLDRHRLQRLRAGDAFDEKRLVFRATLELLVE